MFLAISHCSSSLLHMVSSRCLGSIRHHSTSSILSFLARAASKPRAVTCVPPEQFPDVQYFKPDPPTLSPKYQDHKQFIGKVYGKNYQPYFTQPNTLPRLPQDIKGIASGAHTYMLRSKILRKIDSITTEFFTLKFLPSSHIISSARKSNIAYSYVFTNSKVLGSQTLETKQQSYKGPWKHLTFFHTKSHPLRGAYQRSIYKKQVKEVLFNSLQKYVKDDEIPRAEGVYFFYLGGPPRVKEEVVRLQEQMDNAISQLLRFRGSLDTSNDTRTTNAMKINPTFEPYQTLGYYPKLPFQKNVETSNRQPRTNNTNPDKAPNTK